MGSNRVLVYISSDEEEVDGGDNFDWISELLNDGNEQTDDLDDDVAIVLNPKQSFESSIAGAVKPLVKDYDDDDDDDDDECVILDGDPEKPVEIESNYRVVNESDDLLVVGEKGQVACRDYPHPRYLCANFPFSSTPHEKHCDRCHCYVCDSLAPCPYWAMGISYTNHCNATDKDEFWKIQRKSWKKRGPPPINQFPQFFPLVPNYVPHNTVRPTPLRATSISPLRPRSIIPQNKCQPHLVSQQLLSRGNNINLRYRRHTVGNLGPRFLSPRVPFKRTGPNGSSWSAN